MTFACVQSRLFADDLDRFIESSLTKYKVPGCAVAVIYQGKVLKAQGYGLRKLGKPEKVDADTIFQIASCTKALNASMICTLVSDGKLNLDEPAVNYLPELQLNDEYATAKVTTRDFLAHRSGLPAFTGDLLESMDLSRPEIIRRIRYLPLSNGFRQKAGYSNPGIFLSGMIAERCGGATWEELMRQRLFTPLKMMRSSFLHGAFPTGENIASAHLPNGKSFDFFEDHNALAPAGAVTSSVGDLSRFVLMLLNGGKADNQVLIKPEAMGELFKPVMVETPGIAETAPIDDTSGFAYALVWGVFHYNGYKVIEKGGARMGMRSVIVLVPEKQLGVVVLANLNGTLLPEAIRARVLNDYLGNGRTDLQQSIETTQEKINAFFGRATERPTADPSIHPTRPLQTYVGTYGQNLYGPLKVSLGPQGLSWNVGAHFGGPLLPKGYNSFVLSYPEGVNMIPEVVHFTLDENGNPLELLTESFGRFTRVP